MSGFGLIQALAPLDLPALELGKSAATRLGDEVLVVDGAGAVSRSYVVAKQEFAGYWEYLLDEAIFTAPAHPSWGGAAMVDKDGRLLGIGSLRLQMSKGGAVADINMMVPIDLLPPILDDDAPVTSHYIPRRLGLLFALNAVIPLVSHQGEPQAWAFILADPFRMKLIMDLTITTAVFAVIALVLFGGRGKVSDLMGDFGKGINSFKKGLSDPDKEDPRVINAETRETANVNKDPAPR